MEEPDAGHHSDGSEEAMVIDSDDAADQHPPEEDENEQVVAAPQVLQSAAEQEQSVPDVPEKPAEDKAVEAVKSSDQEPDLKLNESVEDDGISCPICMAEWTNTGAHRLVSLKCGHLFGLSCIQRWLQVGCSNGQRRCPQCVSKASMSHIRPLYARKLLALDTAENDRLRKELEEVKQEKTRLKMDLEHVRFSRDLYQEKVKQLEAKLNEVHDKTCEGGENVKSESTRLWLKASTMICKDGNCRVLAYSSALTLLVVSQISTNPIFTGFGVRKVDGLDFRPAQFVFLHQKQIRDMKFHSQQIKLLLSVSLDKTAKLYDIISNSSVQTYATDNPLWSCCWDTDNPYVFYVGSQNGKVLQYDTRKTGADGLVTIIEEESSSPVASLAFVQSSSRRSMVRGGLFAARLSSCWSYEKQGDSFTKCKLPFYGPFFSLCYDNNTEHLLISSRPSEKFPQTRHLLCQMTQDNSDGSVCCPVTTFSSGTSQKLLSRPTLMSLQNKLMVAAHEESTQSVVMWDVSSRERLFRHHFNESIIDLCPLVVNNTPYLATLSEKSLQVLEFK